jgi:hypothetical protein
LGEALEAKNMVNNCCQLKYNESTVFQKQSKHNFGIYGTMFVTAT